MNEEDSDRIRKLEERISEWESERKQELHAQRSTLEDRNETLKLSMWVTMLGSIPSALLIIAGAVSRYSMDSAATHVIAIFMALVTFAVIVAGAARASGLFAHWWFRDSLIHERRAAAVISLAAAMILFGWVMVFVRW